MEHSSSYQSSSTIAPSVPSQLPPTTQVAAQSSSKSSLSQHQNLSSSSQPGKDEKVSICEGSSSKNTEKTLCNIETDGDGTVPMTTNYKSALKQSKFGSFMGKLLLVKGKGGSDKGHDKTSGSKKSDLYRSAAEKTTSLKHHHQQKQQSLMTANYFQIRKEAPVADNVVVKKTEENTKKEKRVSDSITATTMTTTKADVVIEDDATQSPSNKRTCQHNIKQQNDKDDDLDSLFDDVSSLSSLQSDDSVLGPWMSDDDNNDDGDDSQPWCIDCDALPEQQNALETRLMCDGCKDKWVFQTVSLINGIAGAAMQRRKRPTRPPKEKQNKVFRQQKEKMSNSTVRTSTPASGTRRKGKIQQHREQNLPPPTKSRASKVIQKKSSGKKKDAFVTTGAFMTRNTAKQLADPEHGFHPNPHGFTRMQQVEVLNFNGHWYRGVLTEMNANRVKVEYIDWQDQEEWIIMSSRRLRTIKPDKIVTGKWQELIHDNLIYQ